MNEDSAGVTEPSKGRSKASQTSESSGLAEGKLENYVSTRGAESYERDHRDKLHRRVSDRREFAIYARFFERIGRVDSVLDMPCGYGRLFEFLSGYAAKVHQADISPSMLSLNAQRHENRAASYIECSALDVPLPDESFDAVLSIRLNHHLESEEDRERHLREIMRVSRAWCIVTYFSRTSIKNRLRQLRAPIDKKRPKNTMHPRQAAEIARSAGFEIVDSVPLSRVGSGHVIALMHKGSAQ